jgi:thiamine pyrophosphate-dependent acetolactate synthase large subunit-like protein
MAESGRLDRRELCRAVLADRGDLLVVAGLGAPAWDVTAVGDRPENLPLWGGLGGAAMIGLGLAIAQPRRRVLVVTGDGEMLMGLGSLATIGAQQPGNFSLVVLDNERYGETGSQTTHTAHGVDLAAAAAACGFATGEVIREMEDVHRLRRRLRAGEGPIFAQIKVAAGQPELVLPPRDGALLKSRFREALLGPKAALV